MAVRRQPQPVAALQDENTQITRGNNANAIAAKSGSLEKAQQHQANAWADYEGRIEKVQFCGEDMEAMKENISKEGMRGEGCSSKHTQPAANQPLRQINHYVSRTQPINQEDTGLKCNSVIIMHLCSHHSFGRSTLAIYDQTHDFAHSSPRDWVPSLNYLPTKKEVNRRVAQALSYQTDIPCFLSCAFQKDPPEIKDFLELDCVEDLNNKGNSTCYDMKLQVMDVDYDESFLEWLEIILQNASKYWPALIEEHLW